jgi:hypothetical protein
MWRKAGVQTIQTELILANEYNAYGRYSPFATNPILPNILAMDISNNVSWNEL